MTRTGYYIPQNGVLRHAHTVDADRLFRGWHDAHTVHTDDPDAHEVVQAWNPDNAVWAKANASFTEYERTVLIKDAEVAHNKLKLVG